MWIDDLLPSIVPKTKCCQQVLHLDEALLFIVLYLPHQWDGTLWKDLGHMGTIIDVVRNDVFDFFYEWEERARGRWFIDGSLCRYGFELWVGRAHIIVEPFLMRRVWERARERMTVGGSTGH